MKLKLLSAFLLSSCVATAQSSGSGALTESDLPKSYYVMLAPGGADTAFEIRCAMRIKVVHMEEGDLVGYRFKDRAFLMKCKSEASADAMMSKVQATFRDSKVEKMYLSSYINEGFNEVKKGPGRDDPAFPRTYNTGDNPLDARSYRIEKLDYIATHPTQEGTLPGMNPAPKNTTSTNTINTNSK